MNKILITHNDFDGVTCAVLFRRVWPKGVVYFEDYRTVNERIAVAAMSTKETEIFITDISPENYPVLAEMLDERGNVNLFDHHTTANWLKQYKWAEVDTTRCAAAIFYQWLLKNIGHHRIRALEQLVWHANDYDTWTHESPYSSKLNDLLGVLGKQRFMERFVVIPNVEMTGTEKLLLELEDERRQEYIDEAISKSFRAVDQQGNVYAVVFAERYPSQIGEELLRETEYNYVAIINMKNRTVSLRSAGETDVSVIAKRYGGGGHKHAAGFNLEEERIRIVGAKMLDQIC